MGRLIFDVPVLAALFVSGCSGASEEAKLRRESALATYTVERGEMVCDVTAHGHLESAKSVNIRGEGEINMRVQDLEQMQVNARVEETEVMNVNCGMVATIRVDACPGLEFEGRVQEVGVSPLPTSGGDSKKEYETTIRIEGESPLLRPGLTARVMQSCHVYYRRRACGPMPPLLTRDPHC